MMRPTAADAADRQVQAADQAEHCRTDQGLAGLKGIPMSHIPSSAMKHAGPVHHDDAEAVDSKANGKTAAAADDNADGSSADGIGTGAWIAIGGTLLAGAVAAIAVPLLRGRSASKQGGKTPARGSKKRKGSH
jgi:hypothetical protein